MPTREVNGTPLHYEMQGEGEPLVFVHGSWGDHHNWDLVAPRLAERFRVVSYDRRGHSQSTGPPEKGTVHDDVADLAALIEDLDLAPANVAANSFGTCISLRLVTERPDLVRRLAGHEPPMVGALAGDPAMQPLLTALQERIGRVVGLLEAGRNAEAAEQFVENVGLGPGAWTLLPEPVKATFVTNAGTFLGETRDPDSLTIDLAALPRYSGPLLLSIGDQSPPMFAPIAEKLASARGDVRRHTFAGAGHVPHQTHPDDYVRVVGAFLSE